MKSKLIIAIFLLGTISIVLGQNAEKNTSAMSKSEQEVRKVQSDRLNALATGDISKLDQILGNDFISISPQGKLQTKADVVKDLKSGALKVSLIEPIELTVRVYENTAVINYLTSTKYVDNGKNFDTQIRATSVYVKRDNRWQLISQHMSRVVQ